MIRGKKERQDHILVFLTYRALARRKPRRFNGRGKAIVALALGCQHILAGQRALLR